MSIHHSKLINGNYIEIHQLNNFFEPVTKMLLDHFDTPEMSSSLFLLSSYCHIPVDHFRSVFPNRKIIAYQLEQLMDCNEHINVEYSINNLKEVDEIWDYDNLNIHYLKTYFGIEVNKFLPMLYSPSLERNDLDWNNPEFDVIFYGMLTPRRMKIIDFLQRNLYGKLKFAWVYGEHDMIKHIANSKVVLNLHPFEPYNRQEQTRMFHPVINGRTVISEPSQSNIMGEEIIETSIENMPNKLKEICQSDVWQTFGKESKQKFLDRTKKILSVKSSV